MQNTAAGTKALILYTNKILVLVKSNGDLDLPGGRVEINEPFLDCIRREVFEETSLLVSVIRPVAKWSFIKKEVGLKIKGVTYLCTCTNNTIRLSNEHISFFWVNADEIHRLNFLPSYGLNQISQHTIASWQESWTVPATAPEIIFNERR